jgi:uncharacterized membrane protein YraQ (UPF0718 family)
LSDTRVHAAPGGSLPGHFVRAMFVVVAVSTLLFGRGEESIKNLALFFVSIVLEAFPFMLLGSLVSGFVEEFVRKDRLASILPKRAFLTTVLAALAGIVFPVCECAIVPVVRRFLKKGVPLGAAIAYLLAGPIVNPVVAASTGVAYRGTGGFGWEMVAARLSVGFVVAVVAGTILGRLGSKALAPGLSGGHEHAHDHGPADFVTRLFRAIRHGADEFLDVGQYLVLGAFVAALLQVFIPRATFVDLASTPLLAVVGMMGLAVVLNLCSEADAFVAASFRTHLPMTAQLGFLVLGPMLDLKLIAMYLGVFRKRAILAIVTVVFLLVLAATVALMLLGADAWFLENLNIGPRKP